MERILYGDVLFLINFSMDFLTLCLTGRLLRRTSHLPSLLFSSSLGAVYGVVAVLFSGGHVVGALISVAVSALMCYIVFGRPFLFATALFNGIGMLLGGGVTAAFFALNRLGGMSASYPQFTSRIPFGYSAAAAIVLGIASVIISKKLRARRSAPEVSVTVKVGDGSVSFTALTDTGNLLTEPLSGLPVIITSYSVLEPVIPDGLRELFADGETSRMQSMPLSAVRRVRIIPASGVGGDRLLLALIPDSIDIDGAHAADACIAVTKNGNFAHAAGIVPATLAAQFA